MLISYNWLKRYIPNIPSESVISKLITFHVCELESEEKLPNGDTIFDIKILPDRAHDLLSHYGVAFEIAGLLGLEIKNLEFPNLENTKSTDLNIKIESPNCRRYMGRIIKGIKVGPSPSWMINLLESIGQRSINNIVDATNFVLFDLGHPIHAFDLEKLDTPNIVVRNAKEGEIIALVGQEKLEVELKENDLVITDGLKSLAIAGVKGGLDSGISENTTNLLIEVANFNPISTRKTARRLSILSDASKRYENDLPISLGNVAMDKISYLIKEMCPSAIFEDVVDVYDDAVKLQDKKVSFTTDYISKMLGVSLESKDIVKILKNYKYEFNQNENNFLVTVPEMRLDINGPHDFVEEIGRVYGYDKIESKLPVLKYEKEDNLTWKKICLAKRHLLNLGYCEVFTSIFSEKGDVEILATSIGKNFLRTNISDKLKESFVLNQKNIPLLDVDELKIFEIGAVFLKDGENIMVAYKDNKNIREVSLDVFIDEIIPKGEFDFIKDYLISISSSYLPEKTDNPLYNTDQKTKLSTIPIFKPWSVYPFITRDIAVWVPERISPEALVKIYKDFGTELLVCEPKLFDLFTKDGQTSYAYRLVFQSQEKTLTDDEINKIMSKITEKITSSGWKVR